jgi:nicotinamidase-related amidase
MSLNDTLPVQLSPVPLGEGPVGLVLVDAGVAFTRQGALADPEHMVPMVRTIDALYRDLRERLGEQLHTLCFLDTHHADIPEPPYPPHGVIGTGEEEMDPELRWLLDEPRVTVVRKDCINGFVGSIDRQTGVNRFCEWVIEHDLVTLVVVGDCTDICVSDFVVTVLSARNHGLLTSADPNSERPRYVGEIENLRVVVHEPGCETFHAPGFHDRPAAHHVGLWLMASRGAILSSELT